MKKQIKKKNDIAKNDDKSAGDKLFGIWPCVGGVIVIKVWL